MTLGWGLRGFIGGGPLGAMIPCAMVALLLCLILRLDDRSGGMLAAIGAIGIGLGGQMTYGQTIGFIVQPETFVWGLLGLTVKGGVWGLSGGALLGLGFILRQLSRKDFVASLLVLLVGVVVGWKFINEPRLIYFSNPHDKPRAEIWAGLLLGTLALLGWLAAKGRARLPLHFALWGALGGAIGFGGGGLWMVAGKAWPEVKHWLSWWKFMEFTFGFCFGLTLGFAAWRNREAVWALNHKVPPNGIRAWPAVLVNFVTALVVLFVLWCEASIDVVCTFTFLGVALLAFVIFVEPLAWQAGLTLTICAFGYDLLEKFHEDQGWFNPYAKWYAAVLVSVIFAALLARRLRGNHPMVTWAFLWLTWLAVSVSYLKSMKSFLPVGGHTIVQLIFTLCAVWLTWLVSKHLRRTDRRSAI